MERARKDQLAFEKELFEKKLEYAKGLGSVHSKLSHAKVCAGKVAEAHNYQVQRN